MITRKKPVNKNIERQIAIGCIVSTDYLKQIIPIYFQNSVSQIYIKKIIEFCMEFYDHYQEAPNKLIQDIFINKKDNLDPEIAEAIELFLVSISDEYVNSENEFNVIYYIEKAELHFRSQELEQTRDEISSCLISNNVEEGENVIANFKRIARPETIGVDPFRDNSSIIEAFDQDNGEYLFKLPGDFGKMIGPIYRGMFGIVVGSMGAGKSWMLQEVAIRSLLFGLNVLFVSLEMTKNQMIRRIMHTITGLPKEKYAGKILIPVFDCEKNQINKCTISDCKEHIKEGDNILGFYDAPENYFPCTKCMRINDLYKWSTWYKEIEKDAISSELASSKALSFVKSRLRGGKFKLINPPPNSLTTKTFRIQLDNFEYYEGWVPDVIVTDYADKFKPNQTFKEYRHSNQEIITDHKAIAEEKHCFVLTGSQSNTGRKEGKEIQSGDYAENIGKKAEIDIGWSIFQTQEEKERGIMNAKMMKLRDDEFSSFRKCIILQSLKIGRPYLDSYLT